jgi:hypothetical protein
MSSRVWSAFTETSVVAGSNRTRLELTGFGWRLEVRVPEFQSLCSDCGARIAVHIGLWLAKTSYTRKMNDRATGSIRTVPIKCLS